MRKPLRSGRSSPYRFSWFPGTKTRLLQPGRWTGGAVGCLPKHRRTLPRTVDSIRPDNLGEKWLLKINSLWSLPTSTLFRPHQNCVIHFQHEKSRVSSVSSTHKLFGQGSWVGVSTSKVTRPYPESVTMSQKLVRDSVRIRRPGSDVKTGNFFLITTKDIRVNNWIKVPTRVTEYGH